MTTYSALVLFSGGQDSTTCLAQACHDFPNQVRALTFDYGQRHKIEIEQAKKIAKIANVPLDIIELPFIATLTNNALTRPTIKIEQKKGKLPSTFVDGRNVFFISVGAVKAKQHNISIIYTGVCETDYSGYPDCRDTFIKSLNTSLNLAMDYCFKIRTPLMFLSKSQTILRMNQLGKLEWYKESHTCYEGLRPACKKCPACLLRQKGFDDANITDPLMIEKQVEDHYK